jgi:hypothetical protein
MRTERVAALQAILAANAGNAGNAGARPMPFSGSFSPAFLPSVFIDASLLRQLVDPDTVRLNENFIFMSTVPGYYRGRMGFMHTSRSILLRESINVRCVIEDAKVRTVVARRAIEKLSHGAPGDVFAADASQEGYCIHKAEHFDHEGVGMSRADTIGTE